MALKGGEGEEVRYVVDGKARDGRGRPLHTLLSRRMRRLLPAGAGGSTVTVRSAPLARTRARAHHMNQSDCGADPLRAGMCVRACA